MSRRKSRFLRKPVEPFAVTAGLSADDLLTRMERISFQGRNVATARRIWEKMLASDATIFMGIAGALSAGGMRLIIAHLIEHRHIDCLVSTGANLYHDLHETRGRRHFIGSPTLDDAALAAERIDRVYDTLTSEDEFCRNDEWIAADKVSGHRYALQIVTDVPHFGGASGSSLEEAQSWGKLSIESERVTVQSDVTLALPLLVTALETSGKELLARRKRPHFDASGRLLILDGQALPDNRYQES